MGPRRGIFQEQKTERAQSTEDWKRCQILRPPLLIGNFSLPIALPAFFSAHLVSREDLRQSWGWQGFGGGPKLHPILRPLHGFAGEPVLLVREHLVRMVSFLLICTWKSDFEWFCSGLKKKNKREGRFFPLDIFCLFLFNLLPSLSTHVICWLY